MSTQIVADGICICGHSPHAATEPRVCCEKGCNCIEFRKRSEYSEMLTHIDVYMAKFEKWYDKVYWVCNNMPFVLAMNNTQFIFFWWRYIYPKWNPEEEFLIPEYKKALFGGAKPEAITRAFREVKELHPELVEKYKNLRMWQSYHEEGYREGAVAMKT